MKSTDRWEASLTDGGRYRLLVDSITDCAIYMLDPEGRVTSWNPGARRFKGYDADEIVGEPVSRFYTEEDRAAGLPERALATARDAGRFEHEGWRVRKDGSRFWARVVIDPIREPGGRLIGFAEVTRDLSERREAEEALHRSEQLFRLLVQGVTDYAIYMLDAGGHVSNWNTGAERIKGYRPDEIVGEHFSRFYTEEDRLAGLPERTLAVAIREGRVESEGWRVRKDGSRFWANAVIDVIRDDAGVLVGFAKITRDSTERREAQLALEQAREVLFQSQKMEALGQLTGGIAHDFNNLLTVILGSLELLTRRLAGDERSLSLVDNALRATQRGASLTQRMLTFARRQSLEPRPVDVAALVHGMSDLMQRSVGPTVTIETRFPIGLPRAEVDANHLELALLNLVVNARDAMPDGGSVIVAGRSVAIPAGHPSGLNPGDYLCLSVTDHGEGMDEATLGRAMEPFFTTKGVGKGTGLGLSTVHGLAEQSGGRLLLRSAPAVGTTAEIWLPVSTAPAAAPGAAGEDEAAETAPVRPLVVLAVDDDGLVLMNTAAMLEDLGHTVIEAGSGREALDVLRGGHPVDVVITDQAMPQMTGSQLAAAIREEWPRLPIILATGYAELPAGSDVGLPRLAKPFLQDHLAEALADVVGG